jgi:hypothetical protein
MKQVIATIQGKKTTVDIEQIQVLLGDNPSWGRTRLSEELCRFWNWRTADGRLKDMACRTLLLKLDRAGIIQLPARKRPSTNGFRNRSLTDVLHETKAIHCRLQEVLPLNILPLQQTSTELSLFNCLLAKYHYLGFRNTVGENFKYLIRDKQNRPLACLLFGSAAWKCAPRDSFIGWDNHAHGTKLGFITNNTRFLILPWVRIPHLASHILARVAKRISADWESKYSHPIYLLETFVDRSRFRGTCYQAANWALVGQTQGRTRNDRNHTIESAIKDIYLYPLTRKKRIWTLTPNHP